MAKAKITFSDIGVTEVVAVGTRVIDVSERVGSNLPYGCREGDCGSCLMKVEAGWENLSTPSVIEEKVLREQSAGRHYRLACQAQILGDVTVRPA